MERDFSEAARQELLSLVSQVENEKWCDFTDWVGDRWYDFQEWIGSLDIKNYIDNINEYHKKVIDKNNATIGQIEEIFEDVNQVSADYKARTDSICENINSLISVIDQLSETISPGRGLFTSGYISGNLRTAVNRYLLVSRNLHRIAVNNLPDVNPSFDDEGSYGGDQGSAQKVYLDEDIQEIVRKYYPDYSDQEIRDLLIELNSEGCGYVALCNTIFWEFVGREEEFEEIFGFPMYKDGDLNYNAIIVDLYCDKDKKSKSGTNIPERKDIWEDYLAEHGIDVNVECYIDVTTDNYNDIADKGQIIVAIEPCILEDEAGNTVFKANGGHAMTVTGVTEDGRFIVSSWGKRYYIDPDTDYNRLQFQQVRYD